jgi:predicted metal-dependent phosphoesterase TrpH
MLIDMHTHTLHYSMDSGLSLATLIEKAKEVGLDGVCLTEHNSIFKDLDKIAEFKDSGITILRGMEISTDIGHVLVVGLKEYTLDMLYYEKLKEAVLAQGAAMILAHPTRETESGSKPKWEKMAEEFDAIEACNGSDSPGTWIQLQKQCESANIPSVGGSDAHSYGPIGSCATEFSGDLSNDQDLLDALKSKDFKAVIMNNPDEQKSP